MTKYPSTRPATADVIEVLEILNNHINELETDSPEVRASGQRYRKANSISFGLLALDFILVIIYAAQPFADFQIVQTVILFMAVAFSIFANIRVYREQGQVLRSLREPRQALVASVQARLEQEEGYVAQLLLHSLPTLAFTRARFTQASDVHKDRSEGIFGAASKLGLFPSILAAGVALFPLAKGAPLWAQGVALLITFLIILNQNTAATMHMATADTKLMLGLLDRAIAVKEGEKEAETLSQQAAAVV